ncbi:ferrous iron transporter B [Clostridium sp. MSJ-11]|uniref:Ferrous iron transporter B n=1 Tax=Clostridium mobile TaxID=2841512 RepID=A0ABS6EL16_9CLOT|nr:ferrous iron transporter B [Clostridium mobile]MBU5485817.1 ferrous iron transporter B [Clostridium mobile]
MSCCSKEIPVDIQNGELKILLMGNPNVGKSVIFSKLTGMEVITANYTGTTVSFTHGKIKSDKNKAVLIDVPGTYSLQATSEAEKVAVDFLEDGADAIICVLDSTNLERNLNLAYQIKAYGIPVVYVLNLTDVANDQGIEIDAVLLAHELGAPVVSMVAVKNIGLKNLLDAVWKVTNTKVEKENLSEKQIWTRAEEVVKKVQKVQVKEVSFLEKLGDMCIKPFPGVFIAIFVLLLSLGIVVGGGKGLRAAILLPIVNNYIAPFIIGIVSKFVPQGIFFNILVGEYGVLIKGIEWPLALVLPYVFLFYIVLSFLEDSGYLPRLGVLMDGLLRRIGIQGGNIIQIMMGYGCAVPAILGTRTATSYKERIIVATIVSLAVPCVAQTGAFISLLGAHSFLLLLLVYLISLGTMVIAGVLLNKFIPGKSDPILLEIPNLLIPDMRTVVRKIWIRTKHFLIEAEVPMLIAIAIAALIAETGILNIANDFMAPLTVKWLGLPKEATLGLLLGIIRRELGVLPLLELNLTILQLLVGSVVSLFYIPCLSVLGVLVKEFGAKIALAIGGFTVVSAFLVGGLINHIGTFIMRLV